ncbi:MAG: gluconate 2-dehydrogenase subunit 3 family protein [Candidatus Dadabacteria bacterium]|nr:gluconate 2-dehydrogenase subunit 3 family protein [Candidatus Dadabacteria bacterium]
MKPTRRGFIKTIAVGILGNTLISSLPLNVFAESKNKDGSFEIQHGFRVFDVETQLNMEALADTLVPGSKKIGIKQIFLEYMKENPGLAGFYDAGFWNLDSISRKMTQKPYHELSAREERYQVIDHVRVRNRAFFEGFRKTIVLLYYSSPAVWKKLSYNGPPQPRGFMDYSLPPKV